MLTFYCGSLQLVSAWLSLYQELVVGTCDFLWKDTFKSKTLP
jgi:hypothetical protein